jgi:hypothetical protein
MIEYSEFVDKLKIELNSFSSTPKEIWEKTAIQYVNGFAAQELRRLISLENRRKDGVFFTDSLLAKKVLQILKPSFTKDSVIYDSACGAGNLLIAADAYFKQQKIKPANNNYLLGTDIHNEFVEAAKLRLQINNLLNHVDAGGTNIILKQTENYLIKEADGLKKNDFYKSATHIFINPPFNQGIAGEKLGWASGKVSMAALFMYKVIEHANPGTSIMAILPDVLRSGSRYEKWRQLVKDSCKVETIKLLGQFDKYADVDVYAVKLTKRQNPVQIKEKKKSITTQKTGTHKILQDIFDICVGPVVDNRDPKVGPLHPYVVSRGLEGWSVQNQLLLTRQHKGKTFTSPFVVVKRTSRMGDAQRAVATIINIPGPVFVDNHLIVLKPISGTLRDCKKALLILKDSRTDEWLNDRIRCRHLTVKVVLEIPVW